MAQQQQETDTQFQQKINYIIQSSLFVQLELRLFHWNTKNYAAHIASGNLYTALDPLIDQFVEVYSGKQQENKKIYNPPGNMNMRVIEVYDKDTLVNLLNEYKDILVNSKLSFKDMKNYDLNNIRDTMLAEINRTIYLLQMS